jgi:hypothetical protein
MAKIPAAKIIEDALSEEFVDDYEYWDYVNSLERTDWSTFDEHPWAWYMERDNRLGEGWHLVTINPMHKDATVIYYLKSLGAKFKHSGNEFLIKDEKDATLVALKYS